MNLDEITMETLSAVRKAQQNTWNAELGAIGVDLSGIISLIPAYVPLLEQLSRVDSPKGAKNTQWKALLNVVNSQPDLAVGWDYPGQLSTLSEQDVFSPYVPLRLGGQVSEDAQYVAKGYADAKALDLMNTLQMFRVLEDRKLGTASQAYALPAIGAPTVSIGAAPVGISGSATGGTIAASTAIFVKCAARSGRNFYFGGSGPAGASGTATTAAGTATNAVGVFVAAVKGAVAYDWYVSGTVGGTYYYFTTTTTNTALITSIPGAAQPLPANLPDLSSVAPTTAPAGDTSYTANDFNSMLAAILGDYSTAGPIVTPGTGTTSGAYWASADGAALAANGSSVALIDQMLMGIYQAIKASPTALMMNAQLAQDLSVAILGTNLAVTFLQADDPMGRANVAAGGYVGTYLNKAYGGFRVRIEAHPSIPPGTIIARSDTVNFPSSNIGSVFEVRCLEQYRQYQYGTARVPGTLNGGPRDDYDIFNVETLVCKAPVACGVVSNIAS